jgi:hypothetical protein
MYHVWLFGTRWLNQPVDAALTWWRGERRHGA